MFSDCPCLKDSERWNWAAHMPAWPCLFVPPLPRLVLVHTVSLPCTPSPVSCKAWLKGTLTIMS